MNQELIDAMAKRFSADGLTLDDIRGAVVAILCVILYPGADPDAYAWEVVCENDSSCIVEKGYAPGYAVAASDAHRAILAIADKVAFRVRNRRWQKAQREKMFDRWEAERLEREDRAYDETYRMLERELY
jgi:hypothetical protein